MQSPTTNHGSKKMMTDTNDEIGNELRITKITRQAAGSGTWICGRIAEHRFDALVFPDHAENPEYELSESRISKLWIVELSNGATVCNFDRGWDVRPTNDLAQQIVDFLAAGLSEHVYG
jgi:hypothetical protein